MFSTKLLLVTGAPGWLGTQLVRCLILGLKDHSFLQNVDQDLEVRCLIQSEVNATELKKLSDRIKIYEGDIRDVKFLLSFVVDAKDAILFHCAGIIHPKRISSFFDINVTGTKNLLYAAVSAGVRRAVVVSSNSPFGSNPHVDHFFDESSPYNPYMEYGRSKMQMEQSICELKTKENIEIVIIRSPWFYGPGQPLRQTLFFKMIRDGKFPILGDGNNRRSMVYIDNLCQGLILAAISSKAIGQTYWIADEKPYTMNEIVNTVEYLLEQEFNQKCKHKRLKLPKIVGDIAYLLDYFIQAFGVYSQKIHVLSEMNKTIACSITKAKVELGYKPMVDLKEGMRRSIKWCKERRLL